MGIMTEQMRMIFLIMIFTGMRVSEVVSLKKDCIMGDKITFRQAKNKRLHTRILNTRIKDLLYEYFKKFEDKSIDGYIFPPLNNNSKNTHIQTASVRWAIKKFRDRKLSFIEDEKTIEIAKEQYNSGESKFFHLPTALFLCFL